MHVEFVQELLGRTDASLTPNVYCRVLTDMGDAARATDEALGP